MKKTALFLMPFALFADSFDEFEKDLFGEKLQKNEAPMAYKTVQDEPSQSVTSQDNQAKNSARLREPPKSSGDEKRVLRYTFGGDVLYLKPYFSNVPYLITSDLTNYSNPSPNYSSAKIKSQNFTGDFGFNVWASYMSNWVDLTVEAKWSRFHTTNHQKTYNISNFGNDGYNAPLAITYIWNSSYTEPYRQTSEENPYQSFTSHATGKTTLNLDWLDLMFKFPYATKKHLNLNPFVAVKGFLFNYKNTITRLKNYSGTTQVSTPVNKNVDFLRQHFNAVGPSLGIDATLMFGKGFGFDILAQGSLVFGQLESYNKSTRYNPTADVQVDFVQKNNVFKGLLDLRLGFSYKKDWNKVGFLAEVGYDMHYMPNLMQLINPTINQVFRSDLSTQGVYGGLALRF
jgi:hypothetical protein